MTTRKTTTPRRRDSGRTGQNRFGEMFQPLCKKVSRHFPSDSWLDHLFPTATTITRREDDSPTGCPRFVPLESVVSSYRGVTQIGSYHPLKLDDVSADRAATIRASYLIKLD
mmetsp:Transcript_16292/g.24122  ORF Transcript_16292/g.24122 Transcript_16292/m.24122 type:complete len:112 (-) Transcript_16292:35-370(-)